MALGSTQPLTEMSTTCISLGKGGRCVRLTTVPPSCAVFMKSGILNFLESSGPLQACNGTAFNKCNLEVFWNYINDCLRHGRLENFKLLYCILFLTVSHLYTDAGVFLQGAR
jgi:hypothetical protein